MYVKSNCRKYERNAKSDQMVIENRDYGLLIDPKYESNDKQKYNLGTNRDL